MSCRQHQSGVAHLLSFGQHQSGVASLLSFRQHQISEKIAAFLGFPLFCNFLIQKKGLRILNLIERTLLSIFLMTHASLKTYDQGPVKEILKMLLFFLKFGVI